MKYLSNKDNKNKQKKMKWNKINEMHQEGVDIWLKYMHTLYT